MVEGSGWLRRQQEEATGDVLSAEAEVQPRLQAGMRWCPAVPAGSPPDSLRFRVQLEA